MAAGTPQVTDSVLKGHSCQVANFGANGAVPQTAVVLPANATDLATSQALANAIKAALIACGICA
jgi:hypothetical protein